MSALVLAIIITLSFFAVAPLTASAAAGNTVYSSGGVTITETAISGSYDTMSSIGNGLLLVGKEAEPNAICGIIDLSGKVIVPMVGESKLTMAQC
jgi:hypothetical protein